jgi:DNA repair protein RecN (Recombination protein N)
MIEELRLNDFGAITGELLFCPGLNLIVGETGTGKSLLLSSINFLKGEKSPLAREGTFVEAVFSVKGDELIVRREIKSSRSRFFLNGMRVSQPVVEEKVSPLIIFQSQRLSSKLLKPGYQLKLLDTFCKNEELLKSYQKSHREFKELLNHLEELKRELSARERELEVLKFQVREIEEVGLKEGEEEELLELKKMVENAQTLKELREKLLLLLYEGEPSAMGLVSEAAREVEESSLFQEIAQKLNDIYYELEGVVSLVESQVQPPETEMSLEEIEDRLYQIEKIKRKYGPSLKEVEDFLKKSRERIELLENGEIHLKEAEEKLREKEKELLNLGRELSRRRREGALKLEELLKKEFSELGLSEARIKFKFTSLPEPSPTGLEKVELLFSGNPKLPLSPLSSSISGGELSRLLLAIFSTTCSDETLVFDEIDSGMSGKILRKVAEKLKKIAKGQQVIAVSHSPQLVAAADKVFKLERGERGQVIVRELQKGQELLEELSVMISGSVSEGGLKAALDLVKSWEERWDTEQEEQGTKP